MTTAGLEGSNCELWFLCSFCYRGFLSVKKLVYHKIEAHGHNYDDEPLKRKRGRPRRSEGFAKRTAPIINDDDSNKNNQRVEKDAGVKKSRKKSAPPDIQSDAKKKLAMKFIAPRKTSSKTKPLSHRQNTDKSLLTKVLVKNWLKAAIPKVEGQMSLLQHDRPGVHCKWEKTKEDVEQALADKPESLRRLESSHEGIEAFRLKELGSHLNSLVLQMYCGDSSFLEIKSKGKGSSKSRASSTASHPDDGKGKSYIGSMNVNEGDLQMHSLDSGHRLNSLNSGHQIDSWDLEHQMEVDDCSMDSEDDIGDMETEDEDQVDTNTGLMDSLNNNDASVDPKRLKTSTLEDEFETSGGYSNKKTNPGLPQKPGTEKAKTEETQVPYNKPVPIRLKLRKVFKCLICSSVSLNRKAHDNHYAGHKNGRVMKTKYLKIMYKSNIESC